MHSQALSACYSHTCCQVQGVQSMDDFDFKKLRQYKYWAIGGNHSQLASKQFLNGMDDSVSPQVRNMKYVCMWTN